MTRTRVAGALVVTLVTGGGLVGLAGLGASTGASAAPAEERTWRAPGHTIVKVRGDAANGFSIHRKDGTTLHPPTSSESMAECSEYDTQVERVRCRTEVRVWYRDLADMKRAINWARYDARR